MVYFNHHERTGFKSPFTFEDVQYGLYVLETIHKGKEEIDRGETVPHEEVERRVKQWLTK